MSPETDMILDNEELDIIDYEIYLEPYTEVLWNLVKKNNPSIKKNEIAMYYQKQQYQYNQRFFVPELTFQGGISFSGSDYPLNGPKYSAKVMINFSNIPFMPSSVQHSYGLSNNGLKSINNSISSSFTVTPDYFYNKRLTTVQLQQTQQSYTDEMNKMYEKMCDCTDEEMNMLLEETGEIQSELDASGFYSLESKIEEVANGLGLGELGLDHDVSNLSMLNSSFIRFLKFSS